MRPICGARDSITKRTSYMLSKLLTPLIGGDTHCGSKEDMVKAIKKLNKGEVDENWIVGRLDVNSLYPSLNVDRCVEVVKEKFYQSELVFVDLEWKEVALYLKYHMTDNEIRTVGLRDYVPTSRFNRRPPLFTRSGSQSNRKIRHSTWRFPSIPPDEIILRKMFCEAVAVIVKRTMRLHDASMEPYTDSQKVVRSVWI